MAPALLERGQNIGDRKGRVMRIRTQLRAGKIAINHSEALRVRTTVKAGGGWSNHSEALRIRQDGAISMRRMLPTTSHKDDRLELLVVRAGLRAGARNRGRALGRKRS